MGEGGPVVIVRWDPGVADGCLPVMFRALGIPGTEGMEHKGGQNQAKNKRLQPAAAEYPFTKGTFAKRAQEPRPGINQNQNTDNKPRPSI